MSEFSNHLEKLIHKKRYSVRSFAEQCDIDRTLLQKYISGNRFPKNKDILRCIIQQLCLTPKEKNELMEYWKKEYLGEEVYLQHQSIYAMLENFGNMTHNIENNLELPVRTKLELKMMEQDIPIVSKHMLLSYMWKIIEYETAKEKTSVYLICQMENDGMDNMMKYLVSKEKVSIHHLVCLNSDKEQNQQYNINLLNRLIPLICGKADYNVNFYYGEIQSAFDTSSTELSNLLITDEFVFTFSADMKKGILYRNKEFHQFWMEIFEEKNERTESFLVRHKNVLDTVSFYQNQSPCDISCQLQPCLAYALSLKILKDAICPALLGHHGIIEEFTNMMEQWGKIALHNNRPANINYFLDFGVSNFLETGRIAEFPSEFYTPLPVDVRCRMLDILCDQIESGLIEAHLINYKEFKLDPSLIIQMCGTAAIHFIVCKQDGSQIVMRVTESSIVNAFREFLLGLKDTESILSKEETIKYIREKLKTFSINKEMK